MPASTTVTLRVSIREKELLDAMAEATGVPVATLGRRCLLAAHKFWEANNYLPMPPVIIPASSKEHMEATGQYSDDPENPHGTRRDRKSA